MSQDYVNLLLIVALILPFVGAIGIRVLSKMLAPRITIIVAAVTAVVIVSAVLSLASVTINSIRFANLTLLLPVAPSIDRSSDYADAIMDEELLVENTTPTVVLDVTETPIPTLEPTIVISDTATLTDTLVLTDTTILTDTTTLTDTATLTDTTVLETPTPEPTVAPTAAAASGRTYVVQSGDSLLSIANQFNVSLKQILNANPEMTNPDNLAIGQELKIP